MDMEQWWNGDRRGKLTNLRENLLHCLMKCLGIIPMFLVRIST
jgi:hypothetical protein